MQTLCGLFGKSRQAWYDEGRRSDRNGRIMPIYKPGYYWMKSSDYV